MDNKKIKIGEKIWEITSSIGKKLEKINYEDYLKLKNEIKYYYEENIKKDFIGKENVKSREIEKALLKRQNFLFKMIEKDNVFLTLLASFFIGALSSFVASIFYENIIENSILATIVIIILYSGVFAFISMICRSIRCYKYTYKYEYDLYKDELDIIESIMKEKYNKCSKYKMKYTKRYGRRLRLY